MNPPNETPTHQQGSEDTLLVGDAITQFSIAEQDGNVQAKWAAEYLDSKEFDGIGLHRIHVSRPLVTAILEQTGNFNAYNNFTKHVREIIKNLPGAEV